MVVALLALAVLAGVADAQDPVYLKTVLPRGMTPIGSGPNTTTLYYPQITNYNVSTFSLTDATYGWAAKYFTGGTLLWRYTDGLYHSYDSMSVNLPFQNGFQFFDQTYSSVTVNLNGIVYFSAPTYYYYVQNNYDIGKSTYVDSWIGACWDNLMIYYNTTYTWGPCSRCGKPYYTLCPFGEVRWQITGNVGSRVFTAQWYRVPHYWVHYNQGWVSCQVRLYENTNVIELVYENHSQNMVDQPNVGCYWSTYYGFGATIGIEAPDGANGFGGPNKTSLNKHQTVNYRFTPVPPIVDDGSRNFALPNNWLQADNDIGFEFYGQPYTWIHVSTNGLISFNQTDAVGVDPSIPPPSSSPAPPGAADPNNDPIVNSTTPHNYIALFWDDLRIDQVGTWDRIAYTIQGPPGYRICIIEYNKVTVVANTSLELSGQVVLSEVDNSVELRYDNMSPWQNMSATIGIENRDGSLGTGGPSTSNNIGTLPTNNYKFTPIYPPAVWPPSPPDNITVPASSATGNYPVTWTNTLRAAWFEMQELSDPGGSSPPTGPGDARWTPVYGSPTNQAATALSYSAINRPDGTFWYQVRAWNIAGSNTWIQTANGCVVIHPPLPPVSLNVPFSSTTGNFVVEWTISPSDTGSNITYDLEQDTDPNFTAPVAITPPHSAGTSPYDWEHAINVPPLLNQTYYYRVRADKATSPILSAWTYAANGCTVQLPPPPDPSSITCDDDNAGAPAGTPGITTDNDGYFWVLWGSSAGATGYQLQEATNPQFMGAVTISKITTQHGFTTPSDQKSGTALNPITYYYRIRSVNNTGFSNWVTYTPGVQVIIPIPGAVAGIHAEEDTTGAPSGPLPGNIDSDGIYWILWNAEPNAAVYELQESVNPTMVGAVNLYQGSNIQYQISGKGNGTYYYHVRARNSSGAGPWTTATVMVIVVKPPDAPTGLVVPTSDVDGVFQVTWNASPGAENVDAYQIEEDTNSGFTSPTLLAGQEYLGGTATQANVGVPTPRVNGLYYYRVRAHNNSSANGGWGPWAVGSNPCNVLHPPDAPATLTAANTLGGPSITQDTDGNYVIEWASDPAASTYELQEYQGPPAPGVTSTWVTIYAQFNTNFPITGKTVGTFYYRVRAVNASGSSSWTYGTPVVSVEIIPPNAPANIYLPVPPQSATGAYSISWDSEPGTLTYELQEYQGPPAPTGGSTWTTIYTGANLSHNVFGKTSGHFYYRVRSGNGAGFSATWTTSEPTYVEIVAPNAPATITVPAHSISGFYTVSWAVSPGATGYILEEDTDSGFAAPTAVYNGTASSVYLTNRGNLTSATIYYYRVSASNVVGSSGWTTVPMNMCIVDLQVPPAPAAITVPTSSTTGAYTVSWTPVDGATSYDLEEDTDSGFGTTVTIYTGSAATYNVAGKTNGTYYYRVRGTNVVGSSAWTIIPSNSCVVDLQPPTTPGTLTVPLSSFTGVVSLSWTAGLGALWYEIQEDTDPAFGRSSVVFLGAGSSCILYNRTDGTYYYRIRSINTVGESVWLDGSNPCMVSVITAGLAVMAGNANPMATAEVPMAADVPMLHLKVANNNRSNVSIMAVTFAGLGTGDFSADVQSVELWRDINGDGRINTSGANPDLMIGASMTFAPASTTVTFAGLIHQIAPGAVENWLVSFTFNNASVGATFGVSMAANADISAVDLTWGNNVVIEGAPVSGGLKTIASAGSGDLSVFLGPNAPVGQSVLPGSGGVTVVQISLAASSLDDVNVTRVRLTATGSGSDERDIINASLFLDVNGNGGMDAGDIALGSGVFLLDNGMISFTGITGLTIAAGTTEHLVLVYDFAGGIAGVQTYTGLVLTGGDFTAAGVNSSQAVIARGAPVIGDYTYVEIPGGGSSSTDDPDYSIGCAPRLGDVAPRDILGWLLPLLFFVAAAGIIRFRRVGT
jgi:hypothetical protein